MSVRDSGGNELFSFRLSDLEINDSAH